MKKLILMRHAKAKPADGYTVDLLRDLEEKGIEDARKMGVFLNKEGIVPEKIICSHSNRTMQTLDQVLTGMSKDIPVDMNEMIYENNENAILSMITKEDQKIDTLMVIGHNPSIEILASMLSGDFIHSGKFGTAGVAVIEFELDDWSKVRGHKGKVVLFETPQTLEM